MNRPMSGGHSHEIEDAIDIHLATARLAASYSLKFQNSEEYLHVP